MKNEKGFAPIELGIVLIIIFILSLIAVPNFLVYRDINNIMEHSYTAKDFMVKYPQIKIQQNNNGQIFDRYATNNAINNYFIENEILTLYDGDRKHEVVIPEISQKNNNGFSQITGTNFFVAKFKYRTPALLFSDKKNITKTKKEVKKEVVKTQKPKENTMSLSLGTWIMIFIMMVIVGKISHKITLKTIFKPTKKAGKHVKKEWDDA